QEQVLSIPHASWACASVAWSPNGQTIVGALADGLQFWDARTGKPGTHIAAELSSAVYSPEGKSIAFGGRGGKVSVLEVSNGKPKSPTLLHQGCVQRVEFGRDGTTLVVAGTGNTACVWKLNPPRKPQLRVAHPTEITCVALSPDGKSFAT